MIMSKKLTDKRLAEIEAFEDKSELDLPDFTPEVINSIHFAHPEYVKIQTVKKPVSIRLDVDILETLKKSGKGWQTKINNILRQAIASGQL